MDLMIQALITREMEQLINNKQECEESMNCCTPYGRDYWKYHDRYEANVIKIGYLTELRDKISKVMMLYEEIEKLG